MFPTSSQSDGLNDMLQDPSLPTHYVDACRATQQLVLTTCVHLAPVDIRNNMTLPGRHTIILVQYTSGIKSRTYLDFESVNAAADGIVKMYKQKLKQLNTEARNITYDVSDLFNYMDSLHDLSGLV
eukprot:15366596-Ditylum_brightwellii.AAC.1